MAACRWAADSDVYVFKTFSDKIEVWMSTEAEEKGLKSCSFDTWEEALEYLESIKGKIKIPDRCFENIRRRVF